MHIIAFQLRESISAAAHGTCMGIRYRGYVGKAHPKVPKFRYLGSAPRVQPYMYMYGRIIIIFINDLCPLIRPNFLIPAIAILRHTHECELLPS